MSTEDYYDLDAALESFADNLKSKLESELVEYLETFADEYGDDDGESPLTAFFVPSEDNYISEIELVSTTIGEISAAIDKLAAQLKLKLSSTSAT